MAEAFQVTPRTVFRWERDGVDPDALQLDPGALPASTVTPAGQGPEWRRNLLNWLLDRYREHRASLTDKEIKKEEA